MAVTPEGCVAVAGLAVAGAAVATVAGLDGLALPLAGAASAALLGIPATAALRSWSLDVCLDRGDAARAIVVARRAHAAARGGRRRARSAVDLAVAHLAAGEPAAAVPLLASAAGVPLPPEGVRAPPLAPDVGAPAPAPVPPPAHGDALPPDERADAAALLAIALAHLEAPERALPLARDAAAADPGDPLRAYALGLALLAAGEAAAALPHLVRGAVGDGADLVPSPGERAFALARAHAAVGDRDAAAAALARAAATRPPGPFTRRAAALHAAPPGPPTTSRPRHRPSA